MTDIFSIGHSNHMIGPFIGLLRRHDVTAVADVRSTPYSRRYPQFARDRLTASLREVEVAYVFLGDQLGGKRADMTLADIAKTPGFALGLERLRKGAQSHRIAFMCAEREPLDCHRTMLIARHLRRTPRLAIQHILADGSLEAHDDLERRLVDKMGETPQPLLGGDGPEAWAQAIERAYESRCKSWSGQLTN